MNRLQDQSGFTLVEVLVSLALLSVVSVYTFSAFRVQKDMDHLSSSIERRIEVRAALNVLRQQLQGMQLVFMPGQTENRNLLFDGSHQSVTFASLSEGSRIEGGLQRVTFSLDDSHALLARFEPIQTSGVGPATSIVVLNDVVSLEFGYLSKSGTSSPVVEWKHKDSLPYKIEMQLMLLDDGRGDMNSETFTSTIVVELAW